MVLGRIISFLKAEHLSYVPVKWMTKIFVAGDVLSFILQAAGKLKSLPLITSWIFFSFLLFLAEQEAES